jgi:glycosyltransferase involved in cell wall biosynthesis
MHYLEQADILLSPRIKGQNTPMKIYSYLASGKPVVATAISSHTQVLEPSCAMLVRPEVADFTRGLRELLDDQNLRSKMGIAGAEKAEKDHTYEAFERKLREAYGYLA